MKKISNNIYSKRYGYFVVYIIRGKDGDILIDTGFTNMRRRLKKLLDNFKKNPTKVVEDLIGVDLPEDQINGVVDAVKTKINLDDIGGSIKGLFG